MACVGARRVRLRQSGSATARSARRSIPHRAAARNRVRSNCGSSFANLSANCSATNRRSQGSLRITSAIAMYSSRVIPDPSRTGSARDRYEPAGEAEQPSVVLLLAPVNQRMALVLEPMVWVLCCCRPCGEPAGSIHPQPQPHTRSGCVYPEARPAVREERYVAKQHPRSFVGMQRGNARKEH